MMNSPWASANVAEEVIRLANRAQVAKNKADRVMLVTEKINETKWLEEDFNADLPNCSKKLEKVPNQLTRWKKSAAQIGAGFALALTRVHFSKIKDEYLQNIGEGNPPGKDCMVHLPTFLEATNKIASIIDLETFVEPTRVPHSLDDVPEDEGEEGNE